MNALLRAAALLVLLAGCGSTSARPEDVGLSSAKLSGVRAGLEKLVREKRIAGGVALVSRRGHVVLHEAVGMQDVEAQVPASPDTIFRICSMTKPITSAAVLMLHEEKKLALSDPVSTFIPEFTQPITIHHLLTHTSGISYGFFNRAPVAEAYRKAGVSDGLAEAEGTIADHCRRLAACPLLCEPGTRWEYGLSTDVLGRVIEVASGMTLDEFFRRRIFEPLGMTDTHFRIPKEKVARLAAVYRPKTDKTIERLPDGPHPLGASSYSSTYPVKGGAYYSGGAGLVSTAGDYARFVQALLDGGGPILKPETVKLMTSDRIPGMKVAFESHGDRFGYGVGVVSEAAKDRGLGSPGTYSWGGFYFTYFFADPKEELVGIVMAQLQPWGDLTLWKDFRQSVYDALAK